MAQNRNRWDRGPLPAERDQQPPEIYRQLGATTWMLVRAALALGDTHVMLLGKRAMHSVNLKMTLLQ